MAGLGKTRGGNTYGKKKRVRKKEVAGPYRDQSSVSSVRSKATKREHRQVPVAEPEPFAVPDITALDSRPPRKTARLRKADPLRLARAALREAPDRVIAESKLGVKPPDSQKWREAFPEAAKEADRHYIEHVAKSEGLKEDPLAELAISTAATAGLGGLASLAGKAGSSGLGAVGAKLASTEATIGEQAAEKGLKAVASRTVSKAGTAAKAVRKAPSKVATKEGRTAFRKAEAKRIGAAGRKARRRPVRYTGAAQAAAYPAGAHTDLAHRANALAEGTADAVINDPPGTALATGRGLIGAVTGPLALGRSAVESAVEGDIAPLRNTANEQIKGTVQLAGELLSGDPQRVQDTVENDVGLSYLAGTAALPRLKPWQRARGALRSVAQDVRRGTASELGGSLRVAPKGVESYVFAPVERRAIRKRVAKQVTKATGPERSKAAYHQKQILKELRKAPKARSLRNVKGMEAGDLLQVLAEYGIRTPEDVAFVREHGPTGKAVEGKVTLASALDFAEKHPEILADKHFKKALDAYIESSRQLPAAKAGKGRRARVMAQGDLFGITRPEDAVPVAARPYTEATTRADAWSEAVARDKQINQLRRDGRKATDQAQALKGVEREKLKEQASNAYREARHLDDMNRSLVKALGKYSRPGQALRASSRRKFYDRHLLKEYEDQVSAAAKGAGLAEPAWTHHRQFREPGEIAPSYPTAAARVQHMRSGSLAADDLVDRSLRSLLSGSVVGPRLRAGGQELARRFTEEEMLPVKVDGKTKHVITQEDWSRAVRDRQYDPRNFVLFPARQFKQAILDPFRTQDQAAGVAARSLEQGLREQTPGSKYVVVRREAAKEFAAQVSPQKWAGEALVNSVSKGVSRWLLFSPSWAMIQSVAEAVPMVMAHPELVNPVKIARLESRLRKNQKLNPDEARAFAATAGEAPTSLHTPDDFRPQLDSNPHGIFSDGARALTKSRLGQGIFSLIRLRPFGVFDNWRQGKYRELLLAAEADKQLNGWWAGLKGALHIQKQISDELRNLPKHEQLAALTQPKYRKQLDEMGRHVEAIAGNWQSFTRYERSFAPFLVFYPFVRYSLRWPLTFAKQHPVSATVAAFLGAQNAEQVDKILGHAPSNPLAYAIPVWQDAENESHMMLAGQRAAPGLSAPTQAVVSQKPSQALSVFNPLIGAAIVGATGHNPYTDEQERERGKQAANLLLATSPIARFFDLQLGNEESAAGKRFSQIDSKKKRRSLYEPWADLTAKQFKETEDFSRDLHLKYTDPVHDIWDNPEIGEAIFGKNGKGGLIRGDASLYLKLLRSHNEAQKAGDRATKQEEAFFDEATEELTPHQQEIIGNALERLQGGIFIPTEKKKKLKPGTGIGGPLGGGVGGSDSGPIGGHPIGASIGGAGAGKIGGHPIP